MPNPYEGLATPLLPPPTREGEGGTNPYEGLAEPLFAPTTSARKPAPYDVPSAPARSESQAPSWMPDTSDIRRELEREASDKAEGFSTEGIQQMQADVDRENRQYKMGAGEKVLNALGRGTVGIGRMGVGLARLSEDNPFSFNRMMERLTGIEEPGRKLKKKALGDANEYLKGLQERELAGSKDPGFWSEKLPEVVPQFLAQIGLAFATGGGSTAAQTLGYMAGGGAQAAGHTYNDAYDRMKAQGKDDKYAELAATGEAVMNGAVAAALERVGGKYLFQASPKAAQVFESALLQKMAEATKRGAINATVEGLTGVAQEALADTVRWGVENDPEAFRDWQARYKDAALLSAIPAGAMGAVHQGGPAEPDIPTEISRTAFKRFLEENPALAERVPEKTTAQQRTQIVQESQRPPAAPPETPAAEMAPGAPAPEAKPDMRLPENIETRKRIDILTPDARSSLARDIERHLRDMPEGDRVAQIESLLKNVYEAKVDPLTGLKGRRLYEELDQAGKLGPVKTMVDAIGLGAINKYGQQAGDAYMKVFAKVAEKSGLDMFRVGGDEFVFHSANDAEAQARTDKFNQILERAKFTFTAEDGTVKGVTGARASYAHGENLDQAGARLESGKQREVELGRRAKNKGELPPGIDVYDLGAGQGRLDAENNVADGGDVRSPNPEAQAEAVLPAAASPRAVAPESGSPNVAFRLVDENGKPTMESAHVEKIFPGTKVKDLGNEGFRVTFQNGKFLDIKQVPKIELSDAQWEAAKQAYPELTDADRQRARAAGSLEFVAGDKRVNGIALMKLAAGFADDVTTKHESLHFAKRAGLFSNEEWAALVKEYSDESKSLSAQEEDIAKAREAWTGERTDRGAPTVFAKMRDFARGLLERAGLVGPKEAPGLAAEDVHALMDTAQFWQREMKIDPSGKRFVDVTFDPKELARKANPATSEGGRALVDELRSEMPEALRKEDETTFAEANRILSRDKSAAKLRDLVKQGGRLNDAQTVAAKRLIEDATSKAFESGNVQDRADAMELLIGYDKGGSETARAMRQRRDAVETPVERYRRLLEESMLRPGAEAHRLILEAKKEGNTQRARELVDKEAQRNQDLADKLGVTRAEIEKRAKAQDFPWFAEKLRERSAHDASITDALYEYYVNSLLSGPKTQLVNLGGTGLFASWVQGIERTAATGLRALGGNKYAGREFAERWRGFAPGIREGIANALMTFKTEAPGFELSKGRAGIGEIETQKKSITGKKGRVIRMPSRLASAADAFNKSVLGRMEVGVQAMRLGRKKGLDGSALERFVQEQTTNPLSEAWDAAIHQAQVDTFNKITTKGGEAVVGAARKITEKVPALKFGPFTFTKTPVALIERAYERSPLATLHYLPDIFEAMKTGEWGKVKDPDRLVRSALGWTVVLGVSAMLDRKDEDGNPMITGTFNPADRGKTDLKYRMGWQPQSIRIGDQWYSYGKVEPLATTVASAVDLLSSKPKDGTDALYKALTSFGSQAQSKTFLKDVGDLINLTTQPGDAQDKLAKLEEMGIDKAAAAVPSFVKQAGRAMGENFPERRQWGEGAEGRDRMLRRAIQKTELGLLPDQDKIDLWGQPVKKTEQVGPDALSPIDTRTQGKAFVGDRVLAAWNEQNPDAAYAPNPPSKTYETWWKGEKTKHYMTDEQYHDYAVLSGQLAKNMIHARRWNVSNPTESDINVFKSLIAAARKSALGRLKAKWNVKGGLANEE